MKIHTTYNRCPCGVLVMPGRRFCSRTCAGEESGRVRRERAAGQGSPARWAVYLSDMRQTEDRLVRRVGSEVKARALARRLNARELARNKGDTTAGDGLPVPLYYPLQESEA